MGYLGALVVLVVTTAPATAQVPFTNTYRSYNLWSWSEDKCVGSHAIEGYEPDADGRYPVLLTMHGTYGDWGDGAEGRMIAQEAARLGFVAAAVKYDSWLTFSEPGVEAHTRCIFRGDTATSAVARLCARPKADCSQGVVAVGHSQGGAISARSANYSSLVRAGLMLGVNGPDVSAAKARPEGTRALPNDRVRIVTGRADVTGYDTLNKLTGRACSTHDCLAADGSGWYVVEHDETADGWADHCYYMRNGCSLQPAFDPNWVPPSDRPWALLSGLKWLRSRTGP